MPARISCRLPSAWRPRLGRRRCAARAGRLPQRLADRRVGCR